MKMATQERAHTLLVVTVVLGLSGILAAVLAPMAFDMIEGARKMRAKSDARAIASGILAFNKDLHQWPIWATGLATGPGDTAFKVLKSSDGNEPLVGVGTGWTLSGAGDSEGQLQTNNPGYPTSGERRWQGPYLRKVGADPWGVKFVVNVEKLKPGADFGSQAIYVISAGPNKTIETIFSQEVGAEFKVGGDDIVYRIK